MSMIRLNEELFLTLGDGTKGTVPEIWGYVVDFSEKATEREGHRLLFVRRDEPHAPFSIFTQAIINRCLLNANETAIDKKVQGCLVNIVYKGERTSRKSGRNATKLYDVLYEPNETVAMIKTKLACATFKEFDMQFEAKKQQAIARGRK